MHILIAEQDKKWQQFLEKELADEYEVTHALTKKEIADQVEKKHFDCILLDVESTVGIIAEMVVDLKVKSPYTPILLTGFNENVELIVRCIKEGAFDFVVKPYSAAKIKVALGKALENVSLRHEIDYLRRGQDVIYNLKKIIAVSPPMLKVIEDVKRFAKTDSTVLMTGETGTGKSLLAGAVHFNSIRRAKPFVTINCANIQETLLESELFGHEKGSFTGADKLRVGRFEQAKGGSIFLDEISEMSQALQAKLLRVIEEKCFERVGGTKTINTDVRIIAATNRDLEEMVDQGEFREDLFYRINVLPIRLPALRHRRECLESLSLYLLEKLNHVLKKHVAGFSDEVRQALLTYNWPGNVRQLANTIERSLLLADGPVVGMDSFVLPEKRSRVLDRQDEIEPLAQPQGDDEKGRILRALEQSLWIQKDAAKILGVSPRVLNHKIKKHGITHKRWRKHK